MCVHADDGVESGETTDSYSSVRSSSLPRRYFFAGVNCTELPLNLKNVEGCATFPCLLQRTQGKLSLYAKIVLETVNLGAAICFFRLANNLQRAMPGGKAEALLKNRLVRVAVIAEICLNTFPVYASVVFNWVGEEGGGL